MSKLFWLSDVIIETLFWHHLEVLWLKVDTTMMDVDKKAKKKKKYTPELNLVVGPPADLMMTSYSDEFTIHPLVIHTDAIP